MVKPPREKNIWKTIFGFGIIGILLFIMGSNSNDATMMFIGVALITMSGATFYATRPQYYVYISVVGEDTPTFGSHDIELIQNITNSVNKALIQRG